MGTPDTLPVSPRASRDVVGPVLDRLAQHLHACTRDGTERDAVDHALAALRRPTELTDTPYGDSTLVIALLGALFALSDEQLYDVCSCRSVADSLDLAFMLSPPEHFRVERLEFLKRTTSSTSGWHAVVIKLTELIALTEAAAVAQTLYRILGDALTGVDVSAAHAFVAQE